MKFASHFFARKSELFTTSIEVVVELCIAQFQNQSLGIDII